ncbi:MAG: NAD(+) diphosphatase [Pseudomonadota bacterium]
MTAADDAILFAGAPLDRASARKTDPDWITAQLARPEAEMIAFFRGDPLLAESAPLWLSTGARGEFPADAPIIFLGLQEGAPRFAIDASGAADHPEQAPFADFGRYGSLRDAGMAGLSDADLAILGQGRWVLDWHARHRFCAVCGAPTDMVDGGGKRRCPECGAEHFPRTDPVAIVLPVLGDKCLLGRGVKFPPPFFSALAGFVEPCETLEECAVRETFEEAGVRIENPRYLFSQPWPFPSSLMCGFLADAVSEEIIIDEAEIAEARWVEKSEIAALLNGEHRDDIAIPPRIAIAHHLLRVWADA